MSMAVRISGAFKKFTGGLKVGTPAAPNYSVYFDGTGDYISMPDSADFAFGTGDFTIEAWIYPQGSASFHTYGSDTAGTGGYTVTMGTDNKFNVWRHGDTPPESNSAYARNTWHHIAVVVSSGTQKVYINGTEDSGLTYSPGSITDQSANIGATQGLTSSEGYISNFRVVKGTAVYTSNFTPAGPLTDIANTKLLACKSATIIDESSIGRTLTAQGDAAVNSLNPF